jgi:hypothetical protein
MGNIRGKSKLKSQKSKLQIKNDKTSSPHRRRGFEARGIKDLD